jgi:NDP-sugar pyrophosphorylase family protein
LATVTPYIQKKLKYTNGRETLTFSNGIANIGTGIFEKNLFKEIYKSDPTETKIFKTPNPKLFKKF